MFYSRRDTSEAAKDLRDIFYADLTAEEPEAECIVPSDVKGIPEGMGISDKATLRLSKDGRYLVLGVKELPEPEDKTVPDFEKVKLDIWRWDADYLPTQVKINKSRFDRQTYTALYYFDKPGQILMLADEDMPSVNTMIVYRADMFGLAALYQLRGRVGRGKLKAYAYLTTPPRQRLSDTAQKRLTVMQSLDSLGAGFALASHDLDIRGAGNLLGQEQSGHIREVGVALYQKMLADAIQTLRRRGTGEKEVVAEDYSPQISVGLPVLIPDTYVADLDVRMRLYHRIGDMTELSEIDSLKAELIDRFGEYPVEVDNLLMTVELKILAKSVNIERLEAGPKGASIAFHNNTFPNPAGLIAYISSQMGTIRIRPDQKLIVMRPWEKVTDRLTGIRNIIKKLSEIVSAS